MAIELNEYILDSVLAQLPQLRGLHVIDCARISHLTLFQLLKHTPRLESLSLTTWVCVFGFNPWFAFFSSFH